MREEENLELSLPTWHRVAGIFDGQEHTVPKWPLLGFNAMPARHDALLLGYPALAMLTGSQRCSDASSVHSAKVILDTARLCIALSCTRRLCGLLPAAGAPGLVPPHLLLQWMQQHRVCQAAKLISMSCCCAPPPFPCLPDQCHGGMIIAILQETQPRFAFSSLLGSWGLQPSLKWHRAASHFDLDSAERLGQSQEHGKML